MNSAYPAIALSLGLAASSNAAITFTLDNAGDRGDGSGVLNNTGGWNFKRAGSWANVYWDANNNGTFGEAGENSGNTTASLSNVLNGQTISDGFVMNFAVEGFSGSAGVSDTFRFNITQTDSTVITINAAIGDTAFVDSNGDHWSVHYAFTKKGYGDVISSNRSAPGGRADHKAVLTFTKVPAPLRAALLGLGGITVILQPRK